MTNVIRKCLPYKHTHTPSMETGEKKNCIHFHSIQEYSWFLLTYLLLLNNGKILHGKKTWLKKTNHNLLKLLNGSRSTCLTYYMENYYLETNNNNNNKMFSSSSWQSLMFVWCVLMMVIKETFFLCKKKEKNIENEKGNKNFINID